MAIQFDFEKRIEGPIAPEEVHAVSASGKSCWLDLDVSDPEEARRLLAQFNLRGTVLHEVLNNPVGGRYDAYDNCLHVAVSAPGLVDGKLVFAHVDVILGERYIITLHRGHVHFLDQVRKGYQYFFNKFARSLGFIIFDLWDKLISDYRTALRAVENEVERIQSSILGDVDDSIFNQVAGVMQNLLHLRKNILADREALHGLAVHRSSFVPESTQPFLLNLVGTLERLGADLTVEREILAETLNLYLGIVSHRTNRVVNRLTVLSVIFLPLTFLCGVYGMNLKLPEFEWHYGYEYFWTLVIVIATSLLALMKYKRWLEV